jgi:hypothetical protein
MLSCRQLRLWDALLLTLANEVCVFAANAWDWDCAELSTASGPDLFRGDARRRPTAGACANASITPAICTASASEGLVAEVLNYRRQPTACCEDHQWRLGSAQAASPLTSISTTIRDMSSLLLRLRRREQMIHVNVSKTLQLY